MKSFDMAFPETVDEACSVLATQPDARVIAGGTALTVVMKEGVYAPDVLVNIRGLQAEHSHVRVDGEDVRIGALATLREIETAEPVRKHLPVVTECLSEIAGVRVRNSATIGGHLAHADIHLDLPPVLAGYDAEVIVSDGTRERRLPIEEFMTGYYETDLADDELITEVVIPKPNPATRGTYRKHRYYSAVDWPCVGVAAFALPDGDGVRDVRVLLNSVSRRPILRVDGVDDLVDGSLSEGAIDAVATATREQAAPADDLRGSAAYTERMAGVFTERALRDLREVA